MQGRQADEQTNKDFVIEEVTDIDAAWPELEPLVLGIIEYHRPWDRRVLRADWAPRMRDFLAKGGLTLLARNAEGRAVGFMSGNVRRDFGIFDEAFAYIDNAYVESESRSQGCGTAMLERFEAWCRTMGAKELRLDVEAGNQLGVRFWTRLGFAVRRHEMTRSLESSL